MSFLTRNMLLNLVILKNKLIIHLYKILVVVVFIKILSLIYLLYE